MFSTLKHPSLASVVAIGKRINNVQASRDTLINSPLTTSKFSDSTLLSEFKTWQLPLTKLLLQSCYPYDDYIASAGREARRVDGDTYSPSSLHRLGNIAFLRMAAVSLSPAPHKLGSMTSRRVPLGNVPNAANSPFRAVAAAASKRTRDQVEAQEDFSYDFQPRAKRQALEVTRLSQPTPPRNPALQSAEGRVFNKRSTDARPSPFEQKLLAAAAAKGDKPRQRVERHEKASEEQKDDVRQWQKHYRKSFLSFVFYFESLPEDIRISRSKYIRALGAVSVVSMKRVYDLC